MLLTRKNTDSKFWYAVLYDGGNRRRWFSTKKTSKKEAQAIHDALAKKLRLDREKKRLDRILGIENKAREKLPIAELWEKYKQVNPAPGEFQVMAFSLFEKWLAKKNMLASDASSITPKLALEYLGQYTNSKSFNTYKSCLSAMWKKMSLFGVENPFASIPNRTVDSVHYRPFTPPEIRLLLKNTTGFWKHATLIALHTGLRRKDICSLKWSEIKKNHIERVPSKTSKKHGKAVYIHLHADLIKLFASLPRAGEYVFPDIVSRQEGGAFRSFYGKLLEDLKIHDTKDGKASFHSLRATFITRCEEAGISRNVIQGIVGHGSPAMTELYSHDKKSGAAITRLASMADKTKPKQSKLKAKAKKGLKNG